jgi:hypothetical protein
MQNQWRHPTKWKVVAGVGTAAALGFAGIAYADAGHVSTEPPPINLQGQVATAASASPSTTLWVSPTTTLRVTTTTDRSQSPSPTTTAPSKTAATAPTAGHDDGDCLTDDCSTDCYDVAGHDSCVDSVDVGPDDSLDSID